MDEQYDFSGWATRNNLRCSDGRVILKDAFKDNDGKKVPLVWNHRHNEPEGVLGHALLKNLDEGVYAYCKFNNTDSGQNAKMLVEHGDVQSLSIYANQLREHSGNVMHGQIREVSLVLAGANPGAFIDNVIVHSDGLIETDPEQGIIYTGDSIELFHSDNKREDDSEEKNMPESKNDGKTLRDVFDTLNDDQKVLVMALIEEAIKQNADNNSDDDKENNKMKHNVFDDGTAYNQTVLSHSDQEAIIQSAKSHGVGSLRAAMDIYSDENNVDIVHDDLGINDIDSLFPEYKDVRPGAPEMLTTDQGWISKVLSKVHKSPISRIRTRQSDLRNIQNLRARGYETGTEKSIRGNITLLNRTTDPTTIYVKSKLNRDDIIDITDFDVVQYMYSIDRMNLNEELATAIMVGDGRVDGSDGKIDPTKIRPVWTDDELYTIHKTIDVAATRASMTGTNSTANFGDNYVYAESIIQSLLYAREGYKGSGTPDFYCTPHLLNVMLLARDLNGRRIYDNVNELKAALNVGEIITVEQFEGLTRKTTISGVEHTLKLLGLLYNLADYSLGATKGGEITHFTDFDINFNQEVSLLETRCSGANTRPLSAIALEEDVTGNP